MRRLFGEISMTPQATAEQWRNDRIKRYSPRALAPILLASMPKAKYTRASDLIMQVEALAVLLSVELILRKRHPRRRGSNCQHPRMWGRARSGNFDTNARIGGSAARTL